MDIPMHKFEARQALDRAEYPPRRLEAIHTGAAAALSLVLTAVSWFFSAQSGSGGIAGLGTQAALSTVQMVLQLVSTVVTPFWSAGLVFCALGIARNRSAEPSSLLEGFRRWKPVLSSMLMMGMRYLVMGFIAAYLSLALVMMSPAILSDSTEVVTAWYMGIFLMVFAVLALPLFYRWRMVHYIIMDDPATGGLQAMMMSRVMMNGRKLELFRLDLSFWWFYALEVLVMVPSFAAVLAEGAAFWGLTLLSLGCQFVLYVWAKPKLEVTYALAYETLRRPMEEKSQPPKPHPWND